jgi:tetratricopeptide (TPR) repeat protein
MLWKLPSLLQRSATMILLVLTFAAALGFAAVSHLVTRYTANQQARGRRLYDIGLAAAKAGHYDDAISALRAALTCDPTNSQYQLSLARALRDSDDSTDNSRLEEAQSYLVALWQRTPQDAAVNLALARVAAHRGSVEDATRYYHNAMYGVWNSDADASRNRARVELIQFLLKKGAVAQADSELIALSTALPPDPDEQLQAARLFQQAHDYAGALARYEEVIRLAPLNAEAQAGAGETAYRSGNYALAQRFLRAAVNSNPDDTNTRQLLASADLVLKANPFLSHISDAERNRRIEARQVSISKPPLLQPPIIPLLRCPSCKLAGWQASRILTVCARPPKPIFPTRLWMLYFRSNSKPPLYAVRRKASIRPSS